MQFEFKFLSRLQLMAIAVFIGAAFIAFVPTARAQDAGGEQQLPPGGSEEASELEQFESELAKDPTPEPVAPAPPKPQQGPPVSINTLSDLSKLAPFDDVSVLQKRYLPKTERFQLSGGFTMVTNDPWYHGLGANVRFGYYFRERWGLELSGEFFSHSERDQVKDLKANNNIRTDSIVFLRDYVGADIIWSPIYGKMSLRNLRIIPFDLYFSGGGGMVNLGNATTTSSTAMHLGTGQIFAISKATAFRWNFDWKYFSATPYSATPTTTNLKAGNFSYFMLSVGVSYFFPEAKYR